MKIYNPFNDKIDERELTQVEYDRLIMRSNDMRRLLALIDKLILANPSFELLNKIDELLMIEVMKDKGMST